MLEDRSIEFAFFTVLFSDDLWKEFRKYMYPNKKCSNFYNYRNGDMAAYHGYIGLIVESSDLVFTQSGINYAIQGGYFEIVQCIYFVLEECSLNDKIVMLNNAAGYGHLHIFKFLVQNVKVSKDLLSTPMDYSANSNHLEFVKFLHNDGWSCGTKTMDYAAQQGHLEVVKFLHYNRNEGCSTNAMDLAACNGHFEIVKFLHEFRTEGCTKFALTSAARNNYLKVVKFLCDFRKEGCIKSAFQSAMKMRHIQIIKFLYNKQPQILTNSVMDIALINGNLELVKYFYSTGKLRWTSLNVHKAQYNFYYPDICEFILNN